MTTIRVTQRQDVLYTWEVDTDDAETNEQDLRELVEATDGVPDDADSKLLDSETSWEVDGMVEPEICSGCQTVYDQASGDGYCGLCPECADKGVEAEA